MRGQASGVEFRERLEEEVLRLAATSRDVETLIQGAVGYFREECGFEAVGVRLKDGEDFPYFEVHGFSGEFVKQENCLCSVNAQGERARDEAGRVTLECTCGDVLCGRLDPELPFVTRRGSVWTASTTELIQSGIPWERSAPVRNRCVREGYETVGLFLMKAGEERLGILQLNDRRAGMITAESAATWELVATVLAVSVKKLQADEALARQVELTQEILNATPDYLLVKDEAGVYQEVSQSYCRYLGRTKDQIVGRTDLDLFPLAEATIYRGVDAEIRRTGQPQTLEECITGAEGRRWHLVSKVALSDEEGRRTGVLCSITDISAQRRLEENLRSANQRLELALAAAKAESWSWDLASGLLEWSPGMFGMFGLDGERAEATFAAWQSALYPDDRELAMSRTQAALEQRHDLDSDYRIVLPGGEVRWIKALGRGKYDEQGKPISMNGLCVDITAQKRAEAELRARNSYIETILENAPIGFAVNRTDDGRAVYVSRRFEEIYGLRPGTLETVGDFFEAVYRDPAFRAEMRARTMSDIASGDPARMQWENIPIDTESGERFYISALNIPIPELGLMVSTVQDVTARKKAVDALRESEERWKFALEGAGDGVWDWDIERSAVHYTLTWKEQLGYADDEVGSGLSEWESRLHPEDRERVYTSLNRHLAGETASYQSEHRLRCKDGTYKWFLDRGKVTARAGDGKALRAMGTHTDISERKQAEEELKRLATAIEQAVESVVITDTHGNIVYANPSFEKVTGYRLAEVLGKNPRVLQSGKHDAEFYQNLWSEISSGRVWRGQFHNRRKDGSEFVEDASISPVRDDAGRIVNYIAMKLDVTRETELQTQLAHAQKMESVGRLAGGIAHDFNNILTVINGYSQLLLAKLDAGDPVRGSVVEINKAGERAAGLTSQLLAFSRKQVLQPRLFDVNRLVESMRSLVERLVRESVAVEFDLRASCATVNADPQQIEQVIMNLVVNARDAMTGSGTLSIGTSDATTGELGRCVVVTVRDTGCGMDEATRQRIFEPFFTTKGAGQGTGLGLSMVEGIVMQSGGRVRVESELGRGSTFEISLPARAGEVAEEEMPEQATARGGGETVLVVEDQVEVREYIAAVLQSFGYKTLLAEDAGHALMLCGQKRGRIDLVLTDVVMPGLSGRELAEHLEKIQPGIRVLFISGYTNDVVLEHGILEDKVDFIQKPFSPTELASKVKWLLVD